MFTIAVTPLLSPLPSAASIEMVERKGTGHPDTLCDALAETKGGHCPNHWLRLCGSPHYQS